MTGKTIGIVLVLLLLAGGGYYLLSMNGSTNIPPLSGTKTSDSGAAAIPEQSGSVDDFTASIDAELKATADGIGAMDSETDTEVTDIQSTGDSSRLYDPNNL